MRLLVVFLLACVGLLSAPTLLAGISLSQAIVYFEEDGSRSEDIEVFNQGDETVYIRIEPSVISNPGLSNQTRTSYRDPKSAGLLVTPLRMVIPAHTRKRLRLVRLDNAKQATEDKVYRILVKPEVGQIKAEQTAVKIVVAYEVLVLSQPVNAKTRLIHKFEAGQLHLTNEGNTNLLLLKGEQCPPGKNREDENSGCVELPGKRLYAGNQWQVPLTFNTPVTYQYSVGLENFEIVLKPSEVIGSQKE